MIAYHGKAEVKEFYLARVRAHRAAGSGRSSAHSGGVAGALGCRARYASHSATPMGQAYGSAAPKGAEGSYPGGKSSRRFCLFKVGLSPVLVSLRQFAGKPKRRGDLAHDARRGHALKVLGRQPRRADGTDERGHQQKGRIRLGKLREVGLHGPECRRNIGEDATCDLEQGKPLKGQENE